MDLTRIMEKLGCEEWAEIRARTLQLDRAVRNDFIARYEARLGAVSRAHHDRALVQPC